MNSEIAINKADLLLREIPTTTHSEPPKCERKSIVKEELQTLTLTQEIQQDILETLKFIHGKDLKLNEASYYQNVKSNLSKKYWVDRGNLIVKSICDFSQNKTDDPQCDFDRLQQFALLRVESYGFHKTHCAEALKICEGIIEDALQVLYSKYFPMNSTSILHNNNSTFTNQELQEIRRDEKSALESIYESKFQEKVFDSVWIIALRLDYLIQIFHNKSTAKTKRNTSSTSSKKLKCRNFLTDGICKFGNKCRFSHQIDAAVPETNLNAHLNDFTFDLEIRFPPNSKYPYEPPLILLKTNAILPHLINLHICKRLYVEACSLANDGIPSVFTVTELLTNEDEIKRFLNVEPDFIPATDRLFIPQPVERIKGPTHHLKGITNRNRNQQYCSNTNETNQKIIENHYKAKNSPDFQRMLTNRKLLPVWPFRNDILNAIESNQIVLISGDTGCGKSTQIPQFILDQWLSDYCNGAGPKCQLQIVCTQPRRISAIGVAERVASERCTKIGQTVGYQIRLESKLSNLTRLTFCTTGIILRRLEAEPTLPEVTHIVVDEVHERSVESDFLLRILKDVLPKRPDLKVILMSATLDAEMFSDYFPGTPIVSVPGRTYPVRDLYLENLLESTQYVLEEGTEYCRKIPNYDMSTIENEIINCDQLAANLPKNSVKDENLTPAQMKLRYAHISTKSCKTLFLMDPKVINNDLIEQTLSWLTDADHSYPKQGTILIFLPGIAEITSLYDSLNVHPVFGKRAKQFLLLPLHSSLSNEEQSLIFKKAPNGVRKIVLSTNLAETSITIDDCTIVIDSGKMKEKHFDPNRNMEALETVWVSRANALQRKGRAGRVMPGLCIHLYTTNRFSYQFLSQPISEIQRIPLEQLILNIRQSSLFETFEIGTVLERFIEPPVPEHIQSAIVRLQNVGALDNCRNLTALGHHLALLPLDVRVGKFILYGAIFGCVDSTLTIAACLNYKNPFVAPFGKKQEANGRKMKFSIGNSDHLTVLNAYNTWLKVFKKNQSAARNFAMENYLSHRVLLTIVGIKYQLLELLVDIGFVAINLSGAKNTVDNIAQVTGPEYNCNGENLNVLSSILCAALYPNIVKIIVPSKSFVMCAGGAVPKANDAKDLKFITAQETVFVHPSSVNFKVNTFRSPFLVYQEKVRTSKVFFRDCTMVPVLSLVLFSGFDVGITVLNGQTFVSLADGWILFRVEEHMVAEMIKILRNELSALLEEKIKDPLLNLLHHDRGEKIISTILHVVK